VGVVRPGEPDIEHLEELRLLARTAGALVAGDVLQRRQVPDPTTFIGRGKLDELKELVEGTGANLVIFDDDLSPAQNHKIEKHVGVRVIDRSTLILDVFARHARTHEAKVQVELAQLQYLLPRLTRMWTHLGRAGGGIGTRGPGETQIEADRRRIRARLATLRERLDRVRREREVQRQGRNGLFKIALAGYTNAGKSTLFNALARADVTVEDKLFATLDTTTRRLFLEGAGSALVSDTVGFIRKLPPHLVSSFRTTLDVVAEADLVLHVADASSRRLKEQIDVVEGVLDELVPPGVPRQLVLNKIDAVDPETDLLALRAQRPDAWFCSALREESAAEIRGRLVGAEGSWAAGRNGAHARFLARA
jgi:GTP-binding protein HflX